MPTVVGLWLGDGDLRSEVEAEAKRLRLGTAFQVVNWVPDVRSYVAASDVLLSTSQYESFGYVVAEALAMERPAVATRVTGTIDIFHSAAETLLFSPGDTSGAVRALERVLTQQAFREDVTRLGRLSVIERFSKTVMAGALIDSYRVALA
jgi:glycosyltransferase involved in cell wall biosynthesis